MSGGDYLCPHCGSVFQGHRCGAPDVYLGNLPHTVGIP